MNALYESVKSILETARTNVYRAVNVAMIDAYWHIGQTIVNEEQQGQHRAAYSTGLLKYLAQRLTDDVGEGFNETSLKYMRLVYQAFPIRHTLRDELSWSHYRLLTKVDNEKARLWYMNEAAQHNWSSRALDRQLSTLYYDRLLATRDADRPAVETEAQQKTVLLQLQPKDILKDPYILDFLNLEISSHVHEKDLEQALLNNLQKFMLELGKGFAFVARQQRVDTESSHFYIDLVFYNYMLKCFVLIDLKIGKLTHQDIGQMDMYVRLYEDLRKQPGDNPTIGLVLCSEKDATVVKYSVLNGSEHLFASRYKLFLPTEAELKAELEREDFLIEQTRQTL